MAQVCFSPPGRADGNRIVPMSQREGLNAIDIKRNPLWSLAVPAGELWECFSPWTAHDLAIFYVNIPNTTTLNRLAAVSLKDGRVLWVRGAVAANVDSRDQPGLFAHC